MFCQAKELVKNMKALSLRLDIDTADDAVDHDTVSEEILNTIFSKSQLLTEKLISDQSYILHLDGTSDSQPFIAAAESNTVVHVFKVSSGQLYEEATLTGHKEQIVGVKFSDDNQHSLFTASSDSNIKLWDLRSPQKSVLEFTDTSREEGKKLKEFTTFDVSPNNRLVVAGSALYETDAFLLFWDVRNTKLLGGYWESHTDDITEVKFHPNDSNRLTSGSTDGLINLYDLSQSTEDDALIETFNCESSVDRLTWYKKNRTDAIACVTHTSHLQLRSLEETQPYATFERLEFCRQIKKSSEAYIYVSKAHNYNNDLLVLVGSNYGNGECARILLVKNKTLQPAFTLNENKQIIRSSWSNQHIKLFVTGGENGIVNLWKLDDKR